MRLLLPFILLPLSIVAVNGPAQFSARHDYHGVGNGGPRLMRVADVNGDNIPDIVELAYGTQYTVTTMLGKGNGTFNWGPSTPTPFAFLYGLATADLNNDGIVDVVVAGTMNYYNGPVGIGVGIGNGDGSFQPATVFEAGTDF